jgi:hypothetical protein
MYSYGLLPLILSGLLVYGVSSSGAGQGKPAPKSPQTRIDPSLDPASGPVTLPKLLNLLDLMKQRIQTEGRIVLIIQARGVDFPMTPDHVEQIKAAGATSKLISVLMEKAPTPPSPPAQPAPPPQPQTGSVSAQCRPAECEVSVQGGPYVGTKDSVATISGLTLGDVVVDFRKTGYLGQQRTASVKIQPGEPVIVELQPTQDTQAEFGARLFKAMLDALGGEDAVRKNLQSFSATGSATCYDPDGARTEWNLTASFHPKKATFDAKSSAGALRLECTGETCQPQSPGKLFGKRLPRDKSQKVETDLRQFRSYHLAAILERIMSAKAALSAKTADLPAHSDQHLRVESNGEKYEIVLNAQLLPTLITFESKTGLDSGLSIGLADYKPLGNSQYPRVTEIKFPDAKQGLRVQFDQAAPQDAAK